MFGSTLDQTDRLASIDSLGMSLLLGNFYKQIEDAIEIGENFSLPSSFKGPFEKIIFIGMGGSAIGGDVIRSLMATESKIPVWVSRHYDLPLFADQKSLCIFSSYSGNTEETLSAFQQGLQKRLKSIVITSGGKLARLAQENSIPWIEIPSGFPPRAALGFSVFPILKLLAKLKLLKWAAQGVEETVQLMKSLGEKKLAMNVPARSNPAKQLAEFLNGKFTAIYSGVELLDSAALRLRNQIEENAKAIASHHLIPEMNHNEILGWRFPSSVIAKSACVFLRDSGDHPRIQLRMKITKNLILKQNTVPMKEIHSQGKSRLARLFSMITIGDWVSFYLAILYKIDPTPVVIIESLKKELAGAKVGKAKKNKKTKPRSLSVA